MQNLLYHGDNLSILKRYIPKESIDLIYLDPPFNSRNNYNISSELLGMKAFSDTWRWDAGSNCMYNQLISKVTNKRLRLMMRALPALVDSSMLSYLVMIAARLLEFDRVLKDTGSLFLHCDTMISHYLRLLMDCIFGRKNFVNEIVWKRQWAHNNSKQGARHFGRLHDSILLYAKDVRKHTWNPQYIPHVEEHTDRYYSKTDENGRRYGLADLTAPGRDRKEKANPRYEFLGVTRYWRYSRNKMEELNRTGRIIQTRDGNVPVQKKFLDESLGVVLQDIWTDVKPLSAHAKERAGYPTQKPLALLDRIIKSCTREGDRILDPFCGSGTAIIAAEKLRRYWIGIDYSQHAINVIKHRFAQALPDTKLIIKVSQHSGYITRKP